MNICAWKKEMGSTGFQEEMHQLYGQKAAENTAFYVAKRTSPHLVASRPEGFFFHR